MSDPLLTSIPNVSFPGIPCLPDEVAINDGAGQWLCKPAATACPAGTVLYLSPPSPFAWRTCVPAGEINAVITRFGPNQAVAGLAAPIPTLDQWALLLTIAALAVAGWWKAR